MNLILDTIEFFHVLRSQMRFGEFSRLSIKLRRFEVEGDSAECEWYMRPADPWDVQLPADTQKEHVTEQALRDALKIRELIFRGFPKVQRAGLRMYREEASCEPELMLIGNVERDTHVLGRVVSPAMRAKLYGFRFSVTGGALQGMGSRGEIRASF